MVAHTFKHLGGTWEAEAGESVFEASLRYTVSSRPV